MNHQNPEPECCPKFDPTPWDNTNIEWQDKKFIKDKVFTLFYMPMNFGSVMKRLMATIEKAGVTIPDYLALSDHTSPWNMDIYLAVDQEVVNAENRTITGKFYSKVYEGPFSKTHDWIKDFQKTLKEKGFPQDKYYFWYTTCPKCAKKYGKNYVVILGEI